MAAASLFSNLRTGKLPSADEFIEPANLTSFAMIQILAAVSSNIVQRFSDHSFIFQRKNSRSLIRKIDVLIPIFEFLRDFGCRVSPTTTLCLKEFCSVLHRSDMLLDYCMKSSRLLILLQNQTISSRFHDLSKEISNLLDVLPYKSFNLEADIIEQIELLQNQSRRTNLFIDDEDLRLKLLNLNQDLSAGRIPHESDLKWIFVEKLGFRDEAHCVDEIELMEEEIENYNDDLEVARSVQEGLAALLLYCRYLFYSGKLGLGFRSGEEEDEDPEPITIPKDFCCPISLELMRDPVTISTGQTYERSSITRWIEAGHSSCPKTGQLLLHHDLLPNRSLKSLISCWCKSLSIVYEGSSIVLNQSSSAMEANKASIDLLMKRLSTGSATAAREIRLLAKKGSENRAYIAKSGAIPYLKNLLFDSSAQEDSITAILNLSIYEENKTLIMEEGCLSAIVEVLRHGRTAESRENAAATLFSLSSIHDFKRRICDQEGVVESLVELLQRGSSRGRKDAVTALFNLSTHPENCGRLIDGGGVGALVRVLVEEGVAEEAVAALAALVRRPAAAAAVAAAEAAVVGLIRVMQCGSPKGKENAVAVLLELCRVGREDVRERIFRAPALGSLLQMLQFTGTKRARRKAASLARFSREVKM